MRFKVFTVRDLYTDAEKEELEQRLVAWFTFTKTSCDDGEDYWEIDNEPEVVLNTAEDFLQIALRVGCSIYINYSSLKEGAPRLGIINDHFG
jgi:hypothetical protein